jgi:DNA-binding MarR family transcriptional regulator
MGSDAMTTTKTSAVFNIDDSVTFRISRLFSKINTGVARQLGNQFHLLLREWRALALLAQHEPMSASDLVERSPMDKASVSRAVARLTELGYIHTDPNPLDGRMQTIRLSRSGWSVYRKIAPLSVDRQASLLSVLTAAERKTFFSMLDRIEAQATKHFSDDAVSPGKAPAAKASPKKKNNSQIR